MLLIEKKLVEWIEKHLDIILVVFISVIAAFMRFCIRKVESPDWLFYLSLWFDAIKEGGGFRALASTPANCDYNMLYQFLVAVMTYIPIHPLYQYKILSCIFDYVLAIFSALIVCHIIRTGECNGEYSSDQENIVFRWSLGKAILVYASVLFSLVVIIDSAAMAQCDAIYSAFIVASLYMLMRDKYHKAFILLGLAFAFKLQAMFIMPFYLFYWFKSKKFSLLYFFYIPLVMELSGLPCLIAGRPLREVLIGAFSIYSSQAGAKMGLYIEYPSFWAFMDVVPIGLSEGYDYYRWQQLMIAFTVAVLALIMYYLIKMKITLRSKNMLYIAFLLSFTTVFFLPNMMSRYGYLYIMLSIPIASINKKTIPWCICLQMITIYMMNNGCYSNLFPTSIQGIALINLAVWVAYMWILIKEMQEKDRLKK